MAPNFMALVVAALVPFALGFVWYNLLFNKVWLQASGLTKERSESGNMALIFGLSFVFNLMFMFFLRFLVIHQLHVHSMLTDPAVPGTLNLDSVDGRLFTQLMATYGDRYRSFGHGALHGLLAGVFLVLPMMGVTALYERKSWRYVAINAGYWIVLMMITGSIVCGWR